MLDGEEQTVTFLPMEEVPWYWQYYGFFLVAVLLFTILRVAGFSRVLWITRSRRAPLLSTSEILERCDSAIHQIRALKILSVLMSLVPSIVMAWEIANSMRAGVGPKNGAITTASAAISDALSSFALGITPCIALLVIAFLFDWLLKGRRRRFLGAAAEEGQTPAAIV